jgi:hypothetical protein
MSTFNPYLQGLGEMPVADLVELIFWAQGAVETTEVEWKREWSLDTRPRRAVLAKHIIGFANRDPDRAARIFGGHAFLLIGVEPGAWGSAPQADPAELIQQLEPYTGSDLPWHPVFVEHDGHRVLVIVVDPPQWGDPVRRMARGSLDPDTGQEIEGGTVFVRRPGMTIAASTEQLAQLEARARVPRPRLRLATDWNIGARGNYVAVNVANAADGRDAVLREVGFTMAGTCKVDQLPEGNYAPAEPEEALAYAALPISEGEHTIRPGQILRFRVPLGRLPWMWDSETDVYPYVYFDEGRWLVGQPSRLAGLLLGHGWTEDAAASPMFTMMIMDYVWPESVSGLRSRFDLAAPWDNPE